jgi:hypothetical protein
VSRREEGYHLLASYLPFSPDPKGSSDLRYQINRHRRSLVLPWLTINRLQAWSVPRFGTVVIAMEPRIPLPEIARNEKSAISFEPDVNTDAEFLERLPQERIAALVRELVDLASELAAEGDRP